MISGDNVEIHDGIFIQNNYIANDLDKLKHVSSAGIQALDQDGCMEGTRVSLLNDLEQWSTDCTTHRIFWLDGMAGTGKSAIARSLCRFLHKNRLLGGSFFCLRGNESRANVRRILPTLAWFLACQDKYYRDTLLHILRNAPDVVDYTVERQFEILVEQPLRAVRVDKQDAQTTMPPFVLVIDAIDECADAEAVTKLLKKLLSASGDLSVKFFLSSRPERHILAQFKSPQSALHRILRLHDIEQDLVAADISLYLNKRLADIRSSCSYLPPIWPARRDVEVLTDRAGKLFIYAFTAVKYIEDEDPVDRLQTLTGVTVDDNRPFHWDLDKMYSLVLSAALDRNKRRDKEIAMTKRILGAIFAIREPLYLSDIARLLGVPPHVIRVNIERIHAVINVPHEEDGVVSTFHASFVDFLTTPERAPEDMRITLSAGHRDLADGCLQIMNSDLYFNIAECKTSYLPNSKQTLATIPAPLKYACLYWAHHIEVADDAASFLARLENVLIEKFLFWLEVLSVLGMAGLASSIISRAKLVTESTTLGMTENLVTFLHDANDFTIAFREVIEKSIPHIYLSALPSVRRTSRVAEVFQFKYPSTMKVTAEGIQEQRKILLELRGHVSCVYSVGFSPDGTRVLSSSKDKTIRMWDARTGEEVMKPLKGHTDYVRSVCFSPDGTRIVSGSADKTIRIWDANTGGEVMKLKGHTKDVRSVCFSPDGTRIMSGSADKTIRIWDASTGEVVMKPLMQHTDPVWSVCFSHDGTRIVSGSKDMTIRIWDARTGEEVMKPLNGHTNLVWSVCFSPDGTRIVSGSADKTIRIWDASTGGEVMKLKGLTNLVWSVGFSPDGTRIVSGSADKTIRIWDARSGEVMKALKGHTDSVWSVCFSPDGTRIVSGSLDHMIRIWDARIGEEVMKPLNGRIKGVRCVCVSPDGTCIISGLADKTIRMWDARSGEEVRMPLEGHVDTVESVCFSPDGTRIVSSSRDNTIRIWDASTGKEVRKPLKGHIYYGYTYHHTYHIQSVCFSPDGTRIVSGSTDDTIQIWNASTGKEVMKPLTRHTDQVRSVCFSPDGTRIVSGSMDNTIRIWDAGTGKEVMKPLKCEAVEYVCFSPDGSRIASYSSRTIQIWDAETGEEVLNLLSKYTGRVHSVCFSPDGTRIVSGCSDGTIRIWDARTGEEVMKPLEGHTSYVTSVCFLPDGTRIVSGSIDNTIRIWDVTTDRGSISSIAHLSLFSLSQVNNWVKGPAGELIFWVLPEWRECVEWRMHVECLLIGKSQVVFDPLHYVHGMEWIECSSGY